MSSAKVVTFGEIMLRLKSPGHERMLQSPMLEATFGGAESNVAIALSGYGVPTSFATVLPANAIGDSAIAELRRYGVETKHVMRCGARIGIYFFEAGAAQRPSRVLYDREGSAMATAEPGSFDWNAILNGAQWLHVSGITPAISESAAELCLESVTEAQRRKLTVSCDYNYRANLWKYGKSAPEVMRRIMAHVNVGIAGREDCQKALGIQMEADTGPGEPDLQYYAALAQRVLDEFPNLDKQVITLRESHSANHNGWSACMHNREKLSVSRRYDVVDIVDRVGAGDAFSAGLIYGLLTYRDDDAALAFAAAAGCLKHTIPGDFNRVSVAEVAALINGDSSGRLQR